MINNYAIDKAITYLGKEIFLPLTISYEKDKNPSLLAVKRDNNHVIIKYGQLANLFRGLTLVKEKASSKQYDITLNRHFSTNGLMLDCSRNGVMKKEKVEEMILLEALLGHNRLLLYTEDTYKMDKYPYFGYLRGGYSEEEIKHFVEYGEKYGVELVPCIQTLGHMYQTLKWNPMHQFKDGSDTLLVDSESTYQLIEDMIAFSRRCFKCKDIHIGMDEATQMGLFRYLQMNGYKDRVEMFIRHLSRVIKICQKYDFYPMIWSDMFFRLNSKDEEYYRDTPLPDSTLKLIPRDVKLVYWDYYHDKEKTYSDMIKFHKQAPNEVVFGGGSWRWKGYTPSIKISMEYTKQAVSACVKEKVHEVFITAWGDDGNECSFFTVLPVIAQTSTYDFFGKYDENEIDALLKAISGDGLNDFLLMDLPDQPARKAIAPAYNPSKFLLYQDVLLGIFDSQVKEEFAQNYDSFSKELSNKAKTSKHYSYIYENLANLCNLLSYKADLGIRIRKAYKEGNKKELSDLVNRISTAIERLDVFHESVKKQWVTECKMFGYEVLDGRLGFLRNRLISAKERINSYLSNQIDRIEELEEDILPFDGFDYEIQWNSWIRNVSTSN